MKSVVRRVLVGAAEVGVVLAVMVELAVLWFAATRFPHACCLALGGLALSARARLNPFGRPALQWRAKWYGLAAGVVGLLLIADVAVRHAARGEARLQSCTLSTSVWGRVLRVANVVPEADLFSLGVKASGLLGYWPGEQMRDVARLGRRRYADMAAAEGFAHAGNVAMVSTFPEANRHYFRVLPRGHGPERRLPLLLFLHGAAGNQVLYPWLWAQFADEQGFVVLCPTWDNGEWGHAEGTRLALDALDDTLRTCSIDERRVYLAGMSNGAMTGWAVLAARPEAFRGFVSIAGGTQRGWRRESLAGTQVLLIHGADDRAVPASASRVLAGVLTQAGRSVQLVELDDEDHFVLVRSPETVTAIVAEWIRGLEGAAGPSVPEPTPQP